MSKIEIGTLIHATFRPQDLLPAFMDECERLTNTTHEDRESIPTDAFDNDDHEYWLSLGCSLLINETLIDQLNELAPLYCYFGTTEGDGSDFGFWPDVESIQNSDDILKVSDLSEIPEGHSELVAVVNDHGNMTLYQPVIEYKEIWSIV